MPGVRITSLRPPGKGLEPFRAPGPLLCPRFPPASKTDFIRLPRPPGRGPGANRAPGLLLYLRVPPASKTDLNRPTMSSFLEKPPQNISFKAVSISDITPQNLTGLSALPVLAPPGGTVYNGSWKQSKQVHRGCDPAVRKGGAAVCQIPQSRPWRNP